MTSVERATLARDALLAYEETPELIVTLDFFSRRGHWLLPSDHLTVEVLVDLKHLERQVPDQYSDLIRQLRCLLEARHTAHEWLGLQVWAAELFSQQTLEEDVTAVLAPYRHWSSLGETSPGQSLGEYPGAAVSPAIGILFEGTDVWSEASDALLALVAAGFVIDQVQGAGRDDEEGWFSYHVRRIREDCHAPRRP